MEADPKVETEGEVLLVVLVACPISVALHVWMVVDMGILPLLQGLMGPMVRKLTRFFRILLISWI